MCSAHGGKTNWRPFNEAWLARSFPFQGEGPADSASVLLWVCAPLTAEKPYWRPFNEAWLARSFPFQGEGPADSASVLVVGMCSAHGGKPHTGYHSVLPVAGVQRSAVGTFLPLQGEGQDGDGFTKIFHCSHAPTVPCLSCLASQHRLACPTRRPQASTLGVGGEEWHRHSYQEASSTHCSGH